MSVSSKLGIFHCFSCKAGGNAIKFIMDYENLNYPEAIEKLANISNFTLEYTSSKRDFKEDKKVLEKVGAFYKSLLYKNQNALNYLYSRGFDDELIKCFDIGYAPISQNTINLLENEKIEPNEALDVGIIKQGENGFYASFIERITFAIKNHTGKLVGFGGRTITNHPAKYVNSPESRVFNKSKILYAYDIAKSSIYNKKEIIITEGYMDTIMLHKAGYTNAVAVLGTALTEQHLPLLRRSDAKIVLCFDGDSAGISAAIKSSKLLSINELDASVVIIPEGADPADLVQSGNLKRLENIIENRIEAGEFLIRDIASKYDLSRPIQKQKALEEIQQFTFSLKPIIADSYMTLVAQVLNIDIARFGLSRNQRKENIKIEIEKNQIISSSKDYLELSILKTLLVDNRFYKSGYDMCNEEMFARHFDIFRLIKLKKYDDEQIRELLIDEDIEVINSQSQFFKGIGILKEKYYKILLEDIKHSNDPQKMEKIMKIQNALRKLRGVK
ncbi:DNA primase [Campylobacter blaseri]|nr:DNA primase [Campylobacter blaseri]